MNRTLAKSILGLLVLVASGMVTGGASLPPGTSQSDAVPTQVADPTLCFLEKNLGTCVNCCKDATGLSGLICNRFCKSVPPPAPEPQPEPQP